jgi:hypothetical protein
MAELKLRKWEVGERLVSSCGRFLWVAAFSRMGVGRAHPRFSQKGLFSQGCTSRLGPLAEEQPGVPGPVMQPHQFWVASTEPEPRFISPTILPSKLFK